MSQTIWIITGEPSGDTYGARLALALRRLEPALQIKGMGSQAMRDAGVEILVDASELGVVGFVEVLRHYFSFLRILRGLVRRAAEERPAAVVLIDYPGFNLRLAKRLHALGIPVIYYISPQVWAWGKRRIPELARVCRKMLVIFPFEVEVYAATGLEVEFVGHPLLEILAEKRAAAPARNSDTVVLLPGSRQNEVNRLLPPMLETAAWLRARRPELAFVLAAPNPRIADRCREFLRQPPPGLPAEAVTVETGHTHAWLQRAAAGLAASGTVTMEAAILGLPLVVIYKLNFFSYWLARTLVKIPFFTIVNLVAGRRVYDEYLQGDVRPEILGPALEAILPGGNRRAEVEAGLRDAVRALGATADASDRAARAILKAIAPPQPTV